jgi:hypothetical protein
VAPAVPLPSQEVLAGAPDVIEEELIELGASEAEFPFRCPPLETESVAFYEEGADALVPGPKVRAGEDQVEVGNCPRGNEALGPVEDVMIPIEYRSALYGTGIGADAAVFLGQCDD